MQDLEDSTSVGGFERRGSLVRVQCTYRFSEESTGKLIGYLPRSTRLIPASNEFWDGDEIYVPNLSGGKCMSTYSARFNDWINSAHVSKDSTTYTRTSNAEGQLQWKYCRKLEFVHGSLVSFAFGASLKLAQERALAMLVRSLCPQLYVAVQADIYADFVGKMWREVEGEYERLNVHRQVRTQMDSQPPKESMQGEAIQDSDKVNNTIVTRDEDKTVSKPMRQPHGREVASSEPVARFDHAVDRWMPLRHIELAADKGINHIYRAYRIPESLFQELPASITLMPFKNYIYSDLEVIFKFTVNANRFQAGKVICSLKFDSYQADEVFNTVGAALARPHVVIDLASSNEGELHVPFRFHRTFIRNDRKALGVRPQDCGTVLVQVLSKLRTGTNEPMTVNLRPFVRISDTNFAGTADMVDVIAPQMDLAAAVMSDVLPTSGLRAVLRQAERILTNPGSGRNRDKPSDISRTIVVPMPSENFGSGKGPMNVIPMRVDPGAMTSYTHIRPYGDDPNTTLDIARIWGLYRSFTWSASDEENKVICDIDCDPAIRGSTGVRNAAVTPLEYVTNLYQFWRGPLEFRFDFVSTNFHTGSVQLSCQFGRFPEGVSSSPQASSFYTKTFHLAEQRSVTIRLPYIYDTMWRRTNTPPYIPAGLAGKDFADHMLALKQTLRTRLSLRVVNKLKPPETVSQEIDVLVFVRAADTYRLHSLKQSGLGHPICEELRNFPRVQKSTRNKREVAARGEWNEAPRDGIPIRVATQMDQGTKEDEDPTDQFALGVDAEESQTNDKQYSIKDILRRPTLLLYDCAVNKRVTGEDNTNSGFFIPLRPPTWQLPSYPDGRYANSLHRAPQSSLASLFRFYRGSMRYTILADSPKPLFITHVPHTGVEIHGNYTMSNTKNGMGSETIIGSGLHTEILIPSVNPLMTFECPFDTENNWGLMFNDQNNREYAWRDRGDMNVGHLVITSEVDCRVNVWWSAGDDFEVANFYGVPNQLQAVADFAPNDSMPRTQGPDFSGLECLDESQALEHNSSPMTQGIMPKVLSKRVEDDIRTTLAGVRDVTENINCGEIAATVATINDTVSNINSTITPQVNVIFAKLKDLADRFVPDEGICNKFVMVEEVLWTVATAIVSRRWADVGMSILRSITRILNLEYSLPAIAKFGTAMANYMGSSVETQGPAPSQAASLTGILAGFVSMIFKVSVSPRVYDSRFKDILATALDGRTVGSMTNILRYIQAVYDIITDLAKQAIGKLDPEARALQMLLDNDEAVRNFVATAQKCMATENSSLLRTAPFKIMCWKTYMQALALQQVLATCADTYAKPQLSRIVVDMIRFGRDNMTVLMSCPIRPVPWCVHVVGEPGIGKSHLSATLADKLTSGYETSPNGSHVYTRQPGSKWWNGYSGQRTIVYDDFLNLNDKESIVTSLSELFQLQTRQDFIPEMAAVEKKEMHASPLLVLLLSNSAFSDAISNVAYNPEAVLRRRDRLVEARLRQGFTPESVRAQSAEDSARSAHLEFRFHTNPRDKDAPFEDTWLTWDEMITRLKVDFDKHMEFERQQVKSRMKDWAGLARTADMQEIDIADPFNMFHRLEIKRECNSPIWLPSEAIQQEVAALSEALNQIRYVGDESAAELILRPQSDTMDSVNECSGCQKVESIVHTCASGHNYCVECVSALTESGCELCQAGASTPEFTTYERWVIKFRNNWTRLIELFCKAGRRIRVAIIAAIRYIRAHLVRSDPLVSAPGAPEAFEISKALFPLKARPDEVAKITAIRPTDLPSCPHGHLIDEVDSAIYFPGDNGGRWRVLAPDGSDLFLFVPNSACGSECPLHDPAKVQDFLDSYMDLNRACINRKIQQYYNADSSQKEVLYAQIPAFCRPYREPVADGHPWYHYLRPDNKYKKFFYALAAIGTVVGGIVLCVNMVSGSKAKVQASQYSPVEVKRLSKPREVKRLQRQKVYTESLSNDLIPSVQRYVTRNMVIIRAWKNSTENVQMNAVGLAGWVAIMPHHYLRVLEDAVAKGQRITIEPALYTLDRHNHLRGEYTFDKADFSYVPDTDLVRFVLPKSFGAFKDLTRFIATDADLEQELHAQGRLLVAPTRADDCVHLVDVEITGLEVQTRSTAPDGKTFTIDQAITYDYAKSGICGSVLLMMNRTRPIYSIHVAGVGSKGYGLILTQAYVSSILKGTGPVTQIEESDLIDPIPDDGQVFLLADDSRVQYHGVAPDHLRPYTPSKSAIRPSPLQGRAGLSPSTAPAILTPADPRWNKSHGHSPLYWGVVKHGFQTKDFGTTPVRRAREALWDLVFSNMRPHIVGPRRLAPEEAVVGLPEPFYDPMRLDTSSGYPWVKMASSTTKEAWVNPIRQATGQMISCTLEPRLAKEISRKERLRREGIVPCTIFNDTLKDERLATTKVFKKGATRVVCCSPVDFTIAQRQNMLHFCASLMRTRLDAHCAIGINATSPEWTALYQFLTPFGPSNIITIDYSNFGPSFNAQVADAASDIMVRWTLENVHDVNETELRTLMVECINSMHIAGGTIYQQFCGSPSGASITTVINSVVNMLYIYHVWDALVDVLDKWRVFKEHVRFTTYGDDFIGCVSDAYKHLFNTSTITEYLAKFGIVATSAEKELAVVPLVSISNATFLKRGFKPHPDGQHWLSPLKMSSVVDTVQWIRSSGSDHASTMECVYGALINAHGHGPEFYESFRGTVNQALREAKMREVVTLSWSDIDAKFFRGELEDGISILSFRTTPNRLPNQFGSDSHVSWRDPLCQGSSTRAKERVLTTKVRPKLPSVIAQGPYTKLSSRPLLCQADVPYDLDVPITAREAGRVKHLCHELLDENSETLTADVNLIIRALQNHRGSAMERQWLILYVTIKDDPSTYNENFDPILAMYTFGEAAEYLREKMHCYYYGEYKCGPNCRLLKEPGQ